MEWASVVLLCPGSVDGTRIKTASNVMGKTLI